MVTIVEFHDMESATIHVEVDVPLLKIWRDGFPDSHLRVHLFDSPPCGVADTLAVNFWRYEQEIKITTFSIHLYDHTADRLAVLDDSICLAAVNGVFYRLT